MPEPEDGMEPEEETEEQVDEPLTSCDDAKQAEEGAKSMVTKKFRPRKRQKYAAIRKIMEFYFSDANLTKDRMTKKLVQDSEYVDLKEFLKYNKLASTCKDIGELQRALKESEKLELSQDLGSVKRKIPFDPAKTKSEEAVENCTIYVENIPPHADHDWVEKVFDEFGTVAYISLPKNRHTKKPKGFAFVEYEEEEGAIRCLEAFGEVGACLPSSADPAELQSINTYVPSTEATDIEETAENPSENDDKEEVKMEENVDAGPTTRSRKRPIQINTDELDADSCVPVPSKKKKLEEELENVLDEEEVGTEVKTEEEKKKEDGDGGDLTVPDAGKVEPETDGGVDVTEDPRTTTEKKSKKKRRRRNKNSLKVTREEKLEGESIQLRILPKKHWRQLRNKYLNLQRENMAKLKLQIRLQKQLLDLKESETKGTGGIQNLTNTNATSVCVKIELDKPAASVEVFKAELGLVTPKGNAYTSFVKFIDYKEGALDAIVRVSPSEQGIKILMDNAARVYEKVTRLSGEETTEYWKSVKAEQIQKKKELKKKTKGKDKLILRAEKIAKHIRFEDEEEDEVPEAEAPNMEGQVNQEVS